MTPEELREARIETMAQILGKVAGDPIIGRKHRLAARLFYEEDMALLDQHQPLTAKLLREGDPEGALGDALKYGLLAHDFQLETIDCGGDCCAGCQVDICQRCAMAANSDDWTEFCRINYPEPTEQTEAVES